jgi:hypothetical protein
MAAITETPASSLYSHVRAVLIGMPKIVHQRVWIGRKTSNGLLRKFVIAEGSLPAYGTGSYPPLAKG